MNMKKRLFKRNSVIFFFLITFFCLCMNSEAASFAYDKFNWESFLEQHRNYWVSTYCEENDEKCVDAVLKTKEKFYTRLYELLDMYDRKGYFIDDNIIIETVFYGLTPDSFADKDKIELDYDGQEVDFGYSVDEGSTKDSFIASTEGIGVSAIDYFEKETDSLKTLMNNILG